MTKETLEYNDHTKGIITSMFREAFKLYGDRPSQQGAEPRSTPLDNAVDSGNIQEIIWFKKYKHLIPYKVNWKDHYDTAVCNMRYHNTGDALNRKVPPTAKEHQDTGALLMATISLLRGFCIQDGISLPVLDTTPNKPTGEWIGLTHEDILENLRDFSLFPETNTKPGER